VEPAGDDPGQGHQAQAGGGVAAEPAAGGRRAAAAAPAPAAVAAVPERRRPSAAVVAARRRRPARPRLHRRLRRVPGARGQRETRTGRAARPGHRNGSGEPVKRGADPPAARRAQDCRVREQGTRGTAVRRQVAVSRRRHSSRDHRVEEIVI